MMPLQNTATIVVIKPTSLATTATATGNVDTLGVEEVAINVQLDSVAAPTSNPVVLKVSEADDTETTSFANITELVGDTAFTIPLADGSDPQNIRFNIDCRARKRYLKVSLTPAGTTQLIAVSATLGKAKDSTVVRAQNTLTVDV
jgi:hypothetical protein